jgi:hypothetical protein
MNLQFGTGVLFGVPNAGNLAANPTPYKFGVLQEVSVEFKADLKKLYGQKQFSIARARGKMDVTAKGKFATVDPNLLNQLYFGQTQEAGMVIMAADEEVTGSSATVANSAGFQTDYGVIDKSTGQQLTKVTSGPGAGEYSESGGSYSFGVSGTYAVSYTYSDSTRGTTITLSNQLMGYAPEFRALLTNEFRTKLFGLELFSCTMGSITIPTKQEDFWISDINFDAGVDATDVLGKLYADLF